LDELTMRDGAASDNSQTAPTSALKSYLPGLAKLTLGILILWWLIRSGRFDVRLFSSIRFGRVLFALTGFQFLMLLFPAVRWFILARAIRLQLTPGQAVYIGCMGYFVNIFLPTGIGIDGVRLVYAARYNPFRRTDIVSSILMDRVLGISALALIGFAAAGLLCFHYSDQWFVQWGFALALLLGLMGLAILILFSRRGSGRLKRMVPWQRAHQLADSFRQYRYRKLVLLGSFMLSLLTHLSGIFAAWLGFWLLGAGARLSSVFAFTPLVNLSGMLPITPVGLGVADSVADGLYQTFGLIQGAEVTMLLRCVSLFLSLLGGCAVIVPYGRAQRAGCDPDDNQSSDDRCST